MRLRRVSRAQIVTTEATIGHVYQLSLQLLRTVTRYSSLA